MGAQCAVPLRNGNKGVYLNDAGAVLKPAPAKGLEPFDRLRANGLKIAPQIRIDT
jgi:hypothetical protein